MSIISLILYWDVGISSCSKFHKKGIISKLRTIKMTSTILTSQTQMKSSDSALYTHQVHTSKLNVKYTCKLKGSLSQFYWYYFIVFCILPKINSNKIIHRYKFKKFLSHARPCCSTCCMYLYHHRRFAVYMRLINSDHEVKIKVHSCYSVAGAYMFWYNECILPGTRTCSLLHTAW